MPNTSMRKAPVQPELSLGLEPSRPDAQAPTMQIPEGTMHQSARDAALALAAELPAKRTLTQIEVAHWLGVSRRQVEYWILDGTLLCLGAARHPGQQDREHRRPVTRLPRPYDPKRTEFLTVEELRIRNSNIHG
jgi:hypothetical protein